MKQLEKNYKRVVIKIGSSILTKEGALNLEQFKKIVEQIKELVSKNKEIILVSSGAIAAGMSLLGLKNRPTKLQELQAAASIGQGKLMQVYAQLFKEKNLLCAQVLLTWDDFDKRTRYLNAKNTLLTLLKHKTIPIINENDTVSTDEIKFGDNDRLSSLVAVAVKADLLINLSDVEGLKGPDGVISCVSKITSEIKKLASGTNKQVSVGGMLSKLEAAAIANNSGVPCVITDGKKKNILIKIILENQGYGTIFLPSGKLGARACWIAFGTKVKGRILVDEGAKIALIEKHKSLLCPGIISLEGKFQKGDIVSIIDTNDKEFSRGRVNFSSHELEKTKGKRIAKEVIHRDDLVIL